MLDTFYLSSFFSEYYVYKLCFELPQNVTWQISHRGHLLATLRAVDFYGGPKGSNTNQFTKTQNSFPKHKSICQNTNQFTKTQINFPKHKSVYQNTKQFPKTQINFQKHKSVYQKTNQFHKTQNQFRETQIKRLGTCSVIIREPERDSFPGFPASNMATSNMLSGRSKMFCHNCGSKELQERFYRSQCGTKLDIALPSFR